MAAAIRRAAPPHLGTALPFYITARSAQQAALHSGNSNLPTRLADYLHAMR